MHYKAWKSVTVCMYMVQCETPSANRDGLEWENTEISGSEQEPVIPTLSKVPLLRLLPTDRLAAESPHPGSLTFATSGSM